MDILERMANRLRKGPTQEKSTLDSKYERRSPSPQNAVDLVSGWTGSFPDHLGLTAGTMALHTDPRIHWALDKYGALEGKTVLELGPLEGGHSYIFEQRGAKEVLAIEANKQAYLRCLIAKETNGLKCCRFLLGDFERYLEKTDREFDIILASGILYHMKNPVQVLDWIGQKSQALILWTHYFDADILRAGDPRRSPFSGKPKLFEYGGHTFTLHQRNYQSSWGSDSYCGGPDDTHYWMEREDILALCRRNGFDDIQISFEDMDGANGPSCLFFMRKTQGSE